MKRNSISPFFLILFSVFISSCISVRRTVYLQDKSQEHPQNAVYDTSFSQPKLEYRVQNGDIIYVDISAYNLTESQQGAQPVEGYASANPGESIELKGFTVNSDGALFLPVLGKIQVTGLTINEVRQNITVLANDFYSNPSVKVFLLNNYITVLGEVKTPGRFHVYKDNMSILEGLALAGDCTDFSEKEKVKVMRNENGKTQIYFIDLTDLSAAISPAFYLQPNDVIMVKAQARKKFDTKDFQLVLTGVASLASAVNLLFLINERYLSSQE